MSKFKSMEKIVFDVLVEHPQTRKDDYLLILAVCAKTDADIIGISFKEAMLHHHEHRIPNLKTVERCRRKIQAVHPELKDYDTAEKREEEYEKYYEYAKS